MHGRHRRRIGQREAERLDHAGHRARGAHHHAGADRGREPPAHHFDLGLVHLAGAVLRPQAAAVGAGAEHLALVMADHHRAGRHHDRGLVGRDRAHHLRGQRLVAAADHHHGVHRLRAHHLLGVDRHQVAHVHRGRVREALVDRDGGEFHRQPARQHHAALHRLDQLRHVAVAGVEVRIGVGDADDRPVERVVREALGLDEGLAQEQRKAGIAVGGQTFAQAGGHGGVLGHCLASIVARLRSTPDQFQKMDGVKGGEFATPRRRRTGCAAAQRCQPRKAISGNRLVALSKLAGPVGVPAFGTDSSNGPLPAKASRSC